MCLIKCWTHFFRCRIYTIQIHVYEMLAIDIKTSIFHTNWPITFLQPKYLRWIHGQIREKLKIKFLLTAPSRYSENIFTSNTRAPRLTLKRVAINLIVYVFISTHYRSIVTRLYLETMVFWCAYKTFGARFSRNNTILTKC